MAKHTERTFQLVSFRSLPGGMAYYNTFLRRSPGQLAENFGSTPSLLERGVAILGGRKLSYADYSYELAALPLVPLTIILRQQSAEFEATANILFDSSASNYLPTEQLAGLAEVATVRLIHASKLA